MNEPFLETLQSTLTHHIVLNYQPFLRLVLVAPVNHDTTRSMQTNLQEETVGAPLLSLSQQVLG
jgi:hypothetical protein